MNSHKINRLLSGTGITVAELHKNTKASEKYIEVTFSFPEDTFVWEGLVPYHYRRTGLFLESEDQLATYLTEIKPFFKPTNSRRWIEEEKALWTERSNATVTRPFFMALADLTWVNPEAFPINRNPQRRLQDIKEMGYTIASKKTGRGYARLLLPLPRVSETGYEQISKALKERILAALSGTNVFELSSANKAALIPDHKFPEIRWDETTRTQNLETMDPEDIKSKFQLLDNQRNLQKREVCRKCFQTGERGMLFGLDYYYSGGKNWPADVPRVGRAAEKGCVGCGWYDIEMWRSCLNDLIKSRP